MIEWIDPKERLPGTEKNNILVKGDIEVFLKSKYKFEGHELNVPEDPEDYEPYRNSIKFSAYFRALVKVRSWNGTLDRIGINSLIFEEFYITCCTHTTEEHTKYLKKIGMTKYNVLKFLNQRSFKINWANVSGWAEVE
jgi:hypothetical protein